MKDLYALLMFLLVGFFSVNAHAQVGTSCMGCMPRTGQVYDSTKTTPAPPFTTSASTGDVYIPPREIIVTVPGPSAPVSVGNDPFSFTSTQFTCSAGGIGNDGARGAILAIYKNSGGRCADESGLTWWSSNLVNCIAKAFGWPAANTMDTGGYSGVISNPCNISLDNLASDQPSMDELCRNDASTRGFLTNAYSYVRGPNSATCSK